MSTWTMYRYTHTHLHTHIKYSDFLVCTIIWCLLWLASIDWHLNNFSFQIIWEELVFVLDMWIGQYAQFCGAQLH